ncbi:MAG: hypothetical protein EOP14_02565 [Pseudomonas sp.]|nr:MAG: hypothetical protein EOP14_02565 [Pseudomonas sp.]
MRIPSSPYVVVIAGSFEGISALTRLVSLLPQPFSTPIVASVHGSSVSELERLIPMRACVSKRITTLHAIGRHTIVPGCIHVVSEDINMTFTEKNQIDLTPRSNSRNARSSNSFSADHLFESAAKVYGKGAIGVVLSGRGRDGTAGLQAITEAGGVRIVQSPVDSSHPAMPINALLGDHVQHSILIDHMAYFLRDLVKQPIFHDI